VATTYPNKRIQKPASFNSGVPEYEKLNERPSPVNREKVPTGEDRKIVQYALFLEDKNRVLEEEMTQLQKEMHQIRLHEQTSYSKEMRSHGDV
jgi:hypothetical protein